MIMATRTLDVAAIRKDFPILETDGTGPRSDHTGNRIEQRGLAGTIGADETTNLSALEHHRNFAYRRDAAETNGNVLEGEQHHGVAGLRTRRKPHKSSSRPLMPRGMNNRLPSRIAA